MIDQQYLDPVSFHDPELEQALLGALLINCYLFDVIAPIMTADDLYLIKHQELFKAMKTVYERDGVTGPTALRHYIGRERFEELGGMPYLASLEGSCETTTLAEVYARLVRECAERRAITRSAGEWATAIYQGRSAADVIDTASNDLGNIANRQRSTTLRSFDVVGIGRTDRYLEWSADPQDIRGFRTGLPSFDRSLGGIGEGLYSFLGATSMGKSVLMRQLAIALSKQAPGIFAPSEMSVDLMYDFLTAEQLGISYKKFHSGRADVVKTLEMSEWVRSLPIYGLESPAPTANEIKTFVRQKIRLGQCQWLIVDSGSNMSAPGMTNIYDQTREVANALANIATEFHIPVISSWQIGRSDKDRSSPVPRLGDGKGASDIEYCSLVVVGIFRPAYYISRGIKIPNQYAAATERDAYLHTLKDRAGGGGDDVIRCSFAPELGLGFYEEAKL